MQAKGDEKTWEVRTSTSAILLTRLYIPSQYRTILATGVDDALISAHTWVKVCTARCSVPFQWSFVISAPY